jgi:hypothetical protein
MKERLETDGRPQLVDALKRQETVSGNGFSLKAGNNRPIPCRFGSA